MHDTPTAHAQMNGCIPHGYVQSSICDSYLHEFVVGVVVVKLQAQLMGPL